MLIKQYAFLLRYFLIVKFEAFLIKAKPQLIAIYNDVSFYM